MEGDAGASRLNPTDSEATDEDSKESSEVTAEDSAEAEDGADQTSTEVTAEDSAESESEADPEATVEDSTDSDAEAEAGETGAERGPSRLGRRGWLVGIAVLLVLAAGGLGAGGYLAMHYHKQSQVTARNNAAAIKAAIDCVAATQAPDTTAMAASEQKIIDCGTDDFRAQAVLYTSMLVQAYQAANVHVQVSDVRAAVERNNNDGSVDILVAMRVKVASDQDQKETGYRLRVRMALSDGQYKISKLDQVTK
ncbi:Mce protein [Mycobacterium sp.]|uniref:Mce protein n=1 Tax=Mycobacterium sp. TaxID=1785 RepID=UPI003C731ACD